MPYLSIADGHHRWTYHKAIGRKSIKARVRDWPRDRAAQQALDKSLGAWKRTPVTSVPVNRLNGAQSWLDKEWVQKLIRTGGKFLPRGGDRPIYVWRVL